MNEKKLSWCRDKTQVLELNNLRTQDSKCKHQNEESKNKDRQQTTQEQSAITLAYRGHVLITAIMKFSFSHLKNSFEFLQKYTCVNQNIFCYDKMIKKDEEGLSLISKTDKQNTFISKATTNLAESLAASRRSEAKQSLTILQKSSKNSEKRLKKQLFQAKAQKRAYEEKIKKLQQKIEETMRWVDKQTLKKRESIEGLTEQLYQKNQLIEQLRLTIRQLERRLNCQENRQDLMLQEGVEDMSKQNQRLQALRQKLTCQNQKLYRQKQDLQTQKNDLIIKNQELNQQVQNLKQKGFLLEQNSTMIEQRIKQLLAQKNRLNAKEQRLKNRQKRINICQKNGEKCQMLMVDDAQYLSQKLEAVFTLLYTIQEAKNIPSSHLFDKQQSQLLLAHLEKFTNTFRLNFETPIPVKSNHNLPDLIQGNSFAVSVLNALQQKPSSGINAIKLIQLQTQNCQLIEKISTLKDQKLYLRSVLLNLIKSLQLRSIKREADDILTMLCDFFEYSEQQRTQMTQVKAPKRLFGFI